MPFLLRHSAHNRHGFTLVEMIIVLATLAVVASISMPMYNRYIARNSIEIARQNITQGLERAKLLAQIGMNDAPWGFSTNAIPGRGVLFMGESFLERDNSFDELYSIPKNLTVLGLDEVVFEQVTGVPNTTGTITILSEYNDEIRIDVHLGSAGQVDIPEDWFEICTDLYGSTPQTIRVPDSLWSTYQQDGALLGNCSEIIDNPPPYSSQSSTSSSTNFSIIHGTITIHQDYRMKIDVIGTALNIASGYKAPISVRYKINGPFLEPWGAYEKPIDGNINTDDTFTHTTDVLPAATIIDTWANAFYKKKSWYDGLSNNQFALKQQVKTPHTDGLIQYLVDGDAVPTYVGAGEQLNVKTFLQPYINAQTGLIRLPPNQVLYLFELWTKDITSPDADFQDLVLLITFMEP
jgi:prepilin-type N-terminal cleavage/methylation domain-containing protein